MIEDIGGGVAEATWLAAAPAGADRWVVRVSAVGGPGFSVSPLSTFLEQPVFGELESDNYFAQASLWDFASTTQLSPWSDEKPFVIA